MHDIRKEPQSKKEYTSQLLNYKNYLNTGIL